MELNIEQALKQAAAAHREGKVEHAESLYRSILQLQPSHPDANHNLGVLAVSMNKEKEALPLFKAALEANSNIDQFWVSYIDALIREKQFESAEKVLEQAKNLGIDKEKLELLGTQLPTNRPSQKLLLSLIECYQNERLSESEELAVSITEEFPNHQLA